MNKWKVAFFVVLILALASNGYLFYQLVDSGISYSYLHDNYDAKSRQLNTLGELVVAGADEYTKSDILHLLRQAKKDAFIVEEEEVIHFEGIRFIFEGEKLTKIE
jgi:hypothetical protein